jgi:hypothetical protein
MKPTGIITICLVSCYCYVPLTAILIWRAVLSLPHGKVHNINQLHLLPQYSQKFSWVWAPIFKLCNFLYSFFFPSWYSLFQFHTSILSFAKSSLASVSLWFMLYNLFQYFFICHSIQMVFVFLHLLPVSSVCSLYLLFQYNPVYCTLKLLLSI